MAITYLSCDPADGAIDWFINKSITISFSNSIDSAYVTAGTISILDVVAGNTIDVSLSVSSTDNTKIIVTPVTLLKENTTYRIIVVGEDLGLGVQIQDLGGAKLATTTYITFSTGDTVYHIDTTVQKDAADKTLEGDLFLPTNLKALGYDFTIEYSRPKNHEYDVVPSITGDNKVVFKFSKTLLTGQDYDTWADVSVYQILNNNNYLVSGTEFTATIPDYSVGVTGQNLYVHFSGELPKNLCVSINLTNEISASDGTEYGGEMEYAFLTELYPKVAGAESIKRELKSIGQAYNNDYIAALLHKNTIWLWEKMGRSIDLSNLPFSAVQYIYYSTVIELIEDVDLAKWVKDGVSRRLGDLGISITTMLGKIPIKLSRYEKAKNIAWESLHKGWSFRVGTSTTAYEEAASDISRLWYNVANRYTWNAYKFYQADEPSSNVMINRAAKTNNPVWW